MVTRTKFSQQSNPALDVTWTAPTNSGDPITGYTARYRKQGAAQWTTFSGSLSATTTTLNLSDLEAGATYEAQVRALRNGTPGPWSNTGSGRANRQPRSTEASNLQPSLTLLWGGDDSVRTLNDKFADDDGDSLTYSASAKYPGVVRVGIEGDNSDELRLHVLNPASSSVTYGVHDGYGGYASKTISVSGSAEAFNGADLSRSVAENSAAGTAVGAPVTGTPYDGAALTYSLVGDTDALSVFVIDSSSGQISVKQGASLDYETTQSYTAWVRWTVQGQEADADVTIQVTDIGAQKPDAPTVSRTQFSEPTDPALDVSWTAPDVTGASITSYQVQYRKQGDTAWTLYSYTDGDGDITSALPATPTGMTLPDLAAGATYEFQVRALTSLEGPGPWSDTGSARTNRPPVYSGIFMLDQGVPWGNFLRDDFAPYFPSDPDGDELTYSISSDNPGILSTNVVNGKHFHVVARNPATATVTYGAADSYGGFSFRTADITGVANETRSVAENSPAGTLVGRSVQGVPYDGETLTHTLSGEIATSGLFLIDSATGQISLAEGAALDYETKSSYTGKVHWTVQGQAAVANVTIEVTDAEAGQPDAPTITRTRFDEPTDPAPWT